MVKTEIKNKGFLLRLVQGFILGASGILPGVSGGVLCVVFGIYKPLMEVLASPFKKIKEHFKLLLPVGLGALIGFGLIVSVLSAVMDGYKALAECLFVGLIIGTFPSLFKTAKTEKTTAGSYVALFVSFALIFSLFTYLEYVAKMAITPSFIWYMFAGVIFGISIVLPGLSAYTLLEFFGIFQPMLDAVNTLDFTVLLPVGIGGATALILFAKMINLLYEKHFSLMSHIIIGVVMATTVPLIPIRYTSVFDFVIKLLLFLIGIAVASTFSYLENKFKNEP